MAHTLSLSHPDRGRFPTARWILAGLAVLTMTATALLTLSVLALRPPRVELTSWLAAAALFTGQGVFTLAAVAGLVHGRIARLLRVIGGTVIAWLGGSWAYAALAGPHFEGHALVLGAALAVQGLLTIGVATFD